MAGVYRKICLPNYAVFDEKRYFTPGDRTGIVDFGGVQHRAQHLRGHLGARAAPPSSRPRRVTPGWSSTCPCRRITWARASSARPCWPQRARGRRRVHLLRQRRGRTGRAGVRRAEPGVRPRRVSRGPGAAVRGAAADGRPRSRLGDAEVVGACRGSPESECALPAWGIEIITVDGPAWAAAPLGTAAAPAPSALRLNAAPPATRRRQSATA